MKLSIAVTAALSIALSALVMTASTHAQAQSWAGYVMIHKTYPRNYAEPCWSAAVSKCAREQKAAQARLTKRAGKP
jgi:hypothetical protein